MGKHQHTQGPLRQRRSTCACSAARRRSRPTTSAASPDAAVALAAAAARCARCAAAAARNARFSACSAASVVSNGVLALTHGVSSTVPAGACGGAGGAAARGPLGAWLCSAGLCAGASVIDARGRRGLAGAPDGALPLAGVPGAVPLWACTAPAGCAQPRRGRRSPSQRQHLSPQDMAHRRAQICRQ